MDEHLIRGGNVVQDSELVLGNAVFMKKWFRTDRAIILQLSNGTLQVSDRAGGYANFIEVLFIDVCVVCVSMHVCFCMCVCFCMYMGVCQHVCVIIVHFVHLTMITMNRQI